MVGSWSHEFRRPRADLGTIEHQFHMGRFGVLSAHLEAVGHSHREAHDVAFVAGIHALLHLGVGVRHHSSPVVPLSWYAAAPFPLLLPTSPNRASRAADRTQLKGSPVRSEEHTSELQSLMRISYAVFCLKKKKNYYRTNANHTNE